MCARCHCSTCADCAYVSRILDDTCPAVLGYMDSTPIQAEREQVTVRADVNHHLVLSILQDLVIGLLVLLHRLLHLDGIDLDAVQALRELRVEVELVLILNLPPL